MTLLSVVTVPVAGAGLADPGSVASVDDDTDASDPVWKGGPPAGEGSGGGNGAGSSSGGGSSSSASGGSSSGSAGSSAGGSSPAAAGGGDGNAGGASDGSNAGGNGNAGGSSAEEPDHSNAGGTDGGPPEHSNGGGPPDHSNAGEDGAGPTVTVSTGNGDDGTPPGRSGDVPASSVVEVSVKGAEAGDDVDLDVSPSAVEDDAVAFEGISLTVKREGDFTMRVTNSREPLPGSPAFDPEEAAESLGRIRLDHSITNEEVEEVSYTFRVSKAHLRATDTDFEDVSLYRHADGRWNELPTDVVGETETHYVLSADSPGMSEFAVGAKRPAFDAYWADVEAGSVEAGSVEAGDVVSVSGRVTNNGGADGVYDARLLVDGEVVKQRSVTIAAGGTRQVNFRTRMDRPGERAVAINDVTAGEVTVTARRAETGSGSVDGGLSVVFDRLLDVGQALGVLPAPGGG